MASDYYDLMRVGVEQFAYLKCPSKIRAAVINAGGERVSVDEINRTLARLPKKVDGANIGEPTDGDGQDFRVAGLVKAKRKVKPITAEERARIAELVKRLEVKAQEEPKPVMPLREKLTHLSTEYAESVIDHVCEALRIPHEVFFSDTRYKFIVAARALVVAVLRGSDPTLYSYPRIAAIVGRKDHSTMIHAHRQFAHYCETYPEIWTVYEQLREGGK